MVEVSVVVLNRLVYGLLCIILPLPVDFEYACSVFYTRLTKLVQPVVRKPLNSIRPYWPPKQSSASVPKKASQETNLPPNPISPQQ